MITENYVDIPPGTRVLVTGATGFTGNLLTRKLVDAGLVVSAVAHKKVSFPALSGIPVKWFVGDVADENLMREALKNQEYVFHLATTFRHANISVHQHWKTHVESTRILVNEIIKNPGFKRYVHISTCGVHGHIDAPPADENYRFSPEDDYQRTKLEAELWLKNFAGRNKIPYTVIRPVAIYGPGEMRTLKLFKMALWPVFPVFGNGKCLYHLIHVDDLTDAIIKAAAHPAALNETFIIGAEEPIPVEEIASIIAKHFGKKIRTVRFPIGPLYYAANVCETVCKPFGIEPLIYRRRVSFYKNDRHFDVSKMKKILGFTPRINNSQGIVTTASWYAENGWLNP